MRRTFVIVVLFVLVLADVQPASAASTSWKVYLSATPTAVESGHALNLVGSVSPRTPGKTVQIQHRLPGGTWATVKSAKLNSQGRITYTSHPVGVGPHYYRLRAAASNGHTGDYSATRTVKVYHWVKLLELQLWGGGHSLNYVFNGDVTIGGVVYPNSFASEGGVLRYKFDRPCDRVRGVIGTTVAGETQTGGSMGVEVATSDAQYPTFDYAYLETAPDEGAPGKPFEAAITPNRQFSIRMGPVTKVDGSFSAFGTPEIRCFD